MSDRNEYTPWVELGMTELDYWKAMYLDIQVQWAPVIEAAKAMLAKWLSMESTEVLELWTDEEVEFKRAVEALEEVEGVQPTKR